MTQIQSPKYKHPGWTEGTPILILHTCATAFEIKKGIINFVNMSLNTNKAY
jgi:hypothetical protein